MTTPAAKKKKEHDLKEESPTEMAHVLNNLFLVEFQRMTKDNEVCGWESADPIQNLVYTDSTVSNFGIRTVQLLDMMRWSMHNNHMHCIWSSWCGAFVP